MGEVSLLVTSPVLSHTGGDPKERQIAVRLSSPDLSAELSEITGTNRRKLLLGGCISLIIGDRGAIWRAHNTDRLEDFDAFFGLLSRRPDREMRFVCDLE